MGTPSLATRSSLLGAEARGALWLRTPYGTAPPPALVSRRASQPVGLEPEVGGRGPAGRQGGGSPHVLQTAAAHLAKLGREFRRPVWDWVALHPHLG